MPVLGRASRKITMDHKKSKFVEQEQGLNIISTVISIESIVREAPLSRTRIEQAKLPSEWGSDSVRAGGEPFSFSRAREMPTSHSSGRRRKRMIRLPGVRGSKARMANQ